MRLPRPRLSTIMTWSAVIALVLALVAQQRAAERRDRALKVQLGQSLSNRFSQEGMNRILSDLGIDILKHASGVELLRVSKRTRSRPDGNPVESVVTPTGVALEDGVALRAACVLLDHRNFGYVNADDLSDPQVGLRVKRGPSSLDILISLEGSTPTRPHQDVWIEVHGEGGELVHSAGPICLFDPALQKLTEALLRR
jgi:hypothetical protein